MELEFHLSGKKYKMYVHLGNVSYLKFDTVEDKLTILFVSQSSISVSRSMLNGQSPITLYEALKFKIEEKNN